MRQRKPTRLAALFLCAALAACNRVDLENVSDRPAPLPPALPNTRSVPPSVASGSCGGASVDQASAQQNAVSRRSLLWSPFGREEFGWETYAPRIAHSIGTLCPPDTPGFARALASWQHSRALPADGVLKPEVFNLLKGEWTRERPYVAVRGAGVCPDAPPEARLAVARSDEGYKGKVVLMRPAVLRAMRRMVADARAADAAIRADPDLLTVFSGYRSPESDVERCAREGNCDGIRRASCSVHRTGLAIDLVVGNAPGHPVDSTAEENRLTMSRNPAYRWLVSNAHRYGFVNYAFEPWHWEYVYEPIVPPAYTEVGPTAKTREISGTRTRSAVSGGSGD